MIVDLEKLNSEYSPKMASHEVDALVARCTASTGLDSSPWPLKFEDFTREEQKAKLLSQLRFAESYGLIGCGFRARSRHPRVEVIAKVAGLPKVLIGDLVEELVAEGRVYRTKWGALGVT